MTRLSKTLEALGESRQAFSDALVDLVLSRAPKMTKNERLGLAGFLHEFLEYGGDEYWVATTHEVDAWIFDPSETVDWIEDTLSADRCTELRGGANPTPDEMDLAKRLSCELTMGESPDARTAIDYFCFEARDGRRAYVST